MGEKVLPKLKPHLGRPVGGQLVDQAAGDAPAGRAGPRPGSAAGSTGALARGRGGR